MIITFAQTKGGSGKTTTAMCTVAELIARGSTVAALDLDPNRPLGGFFARVPELKDVQVAVPSPDRRVSALVRDLAKSAEHVVIDLMGAATNDTQVAMSLADSDHRAIPNVGDRFPLRDGNLEPSSRSRRGDRSPDCTSSSHGANQLWCRSTSG